MLNDFTGSKVLIDTEPAGDLISHQGAAVWPIVSPGELAALERMARLCGLELSPVRSRPEAVPPTSTSEVIALGDGRVDVAGRLYAHLTGRHFRRAHTVDDLFRGGRLAVLITTPDRLHSDLLASLYPPPPGTPAPGILCAATPEDLRRQVLMRAAAALPGGPVGKARVDFFPLLRQTTSRDEPERTILAGRVEAGQVREALGCSAGVVTVRAHSSVVHFELDPLLLCPTEGVPAHADLDRQPRCRITSYCHRRKMPVAEAWASGALLSPDDLSARIFLLDSCNGVLQPDAPVDPAWTVAPRLMNSPEIGSFITSWSSHYASTAEIVDLADQLVAGAPLGAALSDYLNADGRRLRVRLCLFGDPRMRLPAPAAAAVAPRRESPERRERKTPSPPPRLPLQDDGPPGELEFVHRAILRARARRPSEDYRALDETGLALSDAALAAIDRYTEATRLHDAGPEVDSAGDVMREALLAYALHRGGEELHDDGFDWGRDAQLTEGSCHICGRRTTRFLASTPAAGASPRTVNMCPRCGLLEDAPAGSGLRLQKVGPRTLALAGPPLTERWCAGLVVRSMHPSERYVYRWPARADGTPGVCDISTSLLIGPYSVMAIVLAGEKLSLFSLYTIDPPAGAGRARIL